MKTIFETEIDASDEAIYLERCGACKAANDALSELLLAENALEDAKTAMQAAKKKSKAARARFQPLEAQWLLTPSGGRYDDFVHRYPDRQDGDYLKRKAAREAQRAA